MPARSNGFDKDPERARRAAKKSKRGKSFKTVCREFLESQVPAKLLKQYRPDGHKLSDKTYNALITAVQTHEALKGDRGAARFIAEMAYGKPDQKNQLSGDNENFISERL